jgi:hypothetical protein
MSSVNSGDSDEDNSDDETEASEDEGSEPEGSDDGEDIEEEPDAISIKETLDTLMELSGRMDAAKGRLQARFPPQLPSAAQPPPLASPPPPLPPQQDQISGVTLLDPYRHSNGESSSAANGQVYNGDWAAAPHIAAALRTLLLDRDEDAERAALAHEHAKVAAFQRGST